MKDDNAAPAGGGSRRSNVPLKLFFLLVCLAWTLVIFVSLWYNLREIRVHAFDSARLQARTAFEKDVMYRRWNSVHGGIFVFVTNSTRPNPYLNNPGRDLTVDDGRLLTKINPAFMTRLVHELGASQSGVIGHITSTRPIRAGNAPDAWERTGLGKIESGEAEEVAEIQPLGKREYLRLIRGLTTEQSCIACHPDYTVGSVRGGISVSVPMEPFLETASRSSQILFGSHMGIWLVGLLGLSFGTKRLAVGLRERDKAEQSLRELTDELEERVRRRTADLNRRRGELQAVMENAGAGIFLQDESGAYILVNSRFAAMLDKSVDDVVGRNARALLAPEVHNRLAVHEARAAAERACLELTNAFAVPDGSTFSWFSFPVFEGERLLGMGGLVVDMTERERLERVLREARDEAEKASRAKSDFLANMSHEIRTPLNGVIGMADLLLRTRLSPDQASMAAAIKTSGDSLLVVLNDVLDISKIEAGKLSLESAPFLLRDVLFDAIKGLTPIAFKKNIEMILHISPQVPDQVTGDPGRLRQILLNLVGNALKFTEHGEVVVTALPVSQTEQTALLRFSVTDTGIGIAPEKQKSIFNAFEQADTSTTRKYGGTGLGLAICSSLLRLMGSRLELKSHPGFGSSFWFELELPVDTGTAPQKPLVCAEAIKGRHVLIVDDNETNLRILNETLAGWGLEVRRSKSADEALALAKVAAGSKRPFQIILSDLQMPEKDGVDLLRAVRADAELKDLPIILLTSGNLPTAVMSETGKPGFFQAVLDKPVRPETLLRAMAAALDIWESYDGQEIERSAKQEIEAVPKGAALRVLLAEDVEMNQMVATRMLNELGHEVVVAGDGKQALEALRAEAYDLVFMDIQMPVMDGIQATLAIREMERQGIIEDKVRIVAMTANALKGDRDKYLSVGMDGYIAKPILLGNLRKVIAEVMQYGQTPASAECAPVAQGHRTGEGGWYDVLEAGKDGAAPAEGPGTPAESAEIDTTGEADAINWPMLERSFSGNEEFIRESMRLYLRDAPKLAQDAADALARSDNSGLTVAAHALKGITGYFTRSGAYSLALALEEAGRAGLQDRRAEAERLLEELNAHIGLIFTEMKEYMEKNRA